MKYDTLYDIHKISVMIFVAIYLVKTTLLLVNAKALASMTRITKVPEMIVSFLFLATGVWMLTQMPEIKTLLIVKIAVVLVSIPVAVIGFKKQNKALGVLAFVMIVGAYGLAEMSKKPANKAASSAVDGKEIYTANCTKCHGDDGKAGIMGAYDLTASTLDKNGMMEVVKNGKERMAAWKGALTDEQISAVCDYVMTLKK